jgi:hypothetical protein
MAPLVVSSTKDWPTPTAVVTPMSAFHALETKLVPVTFRSLGNALATVFPVSAVAVHSK